MKKIKQLALLAISLLLFACQEDTEVIKGRVSIYDSFHAINSNGGEPTEGLPIHIYYQANPDEDVPINQQKFHCLSHTDSEGYYQFTTELFDSEGLRRFNAYFLKSCPFDSTLTEWQYVKDSSTLNYYFSLMDNYPGDDFAAGNIIPWVTDLKGHVYDYNFNNLKVLPAGWVVFDFENLTGSVDVSQISTMQFLSFNAFRSYSCEPFVLAPNQEHSFRIKDRSTYQTLSEFSLHINNSYDPSSTPGNERLVPDTIRVDMATMEVKHIRAQF